MMLPSLSSAMPSGVGQISGSCTSNRGVFEAAHGSASAAQAAVVVKNAAPIVAAAVRKSEKGKAAFERDT